MAAVVGADDCRDGGDVGGGSGGNEGITGDNEKFPGGNTKGEIKNNTVSGAIDEAISSHAVALYGKSWCGYCQRAKSIIGEALCEAGAGPSDYFELDIDGLGSSTEAAYQNELQKRTGGRSVPRIFIAQSSVGGCDDVTALARSGKLVPMVQEALKKKGSSTSDGVRAANL